MITNQFMPVLWTTCRHVTSGKVETGDMDVKTRQIDVECSGTYIKKNSGGAYKI
jgi:hypothetical protein